MTISDQNTLKHIKRDQSISKLKLIAIQEVVSQYDMAQRDVKTAIEKSPLRHFTRKNLCGNRLAFSFVVKREFVFTLEDRLESRLNAEKVVTLLKPTKFLTYK